MLLPIAGKEASRAAGKKPGARRKAG
jgi:hypothetical protein